MIPESEKLFTQILPHGRHNEKEEDMAGRKKKLWIVPVTAGVIVILGAGGLIYRGISQKAAQSAESGLTGLSGTGADREAGSFESGAAQGAGSSESGATQDAGGTEALTVDRRNAVTWNGTTYEYNDHLSNFLFLGIDNREKTETKTGQANAGQADAIFLLSWDRVTSDMTLISIPRDTMTDIEVFSADGESLGMTRDHISLSFAYGDGSYESCELTEEAVSNLLYGVPIQGCCAINMDGIPVLAEAVGGVTVTVPNDSLETADPPYQEGEEVTLTAENAEAFVRYRDTDESQSALARLERQNAFLNAYGQRVQGVFAGDPGVVTKIYESLEPYMVTNIGNDQFLKIMEGAAGGDAAVERWTLPGEGTEGASFDEYHADDQALYERILQTFYEEA